MKGTFDDVDAMECRLNDKANPHVGYHECVITDGGNDTKLSVKKLEVDTNEHSYELTDRGTYSAGFFAEDTVCEYDTTDMTLSCED